MIRYRKKIPQVSHYSPSLTKIVHKLQVSRTRVLLNHALDGLIGSLSAMVLVIVGIQFWSMLTSNSVAFTPTLRHAPIAGLLVIVAMLSAIVYAWTRYPDLLAIARLADRQFQLEERLSTALELGRDVTNKAQMLPLVKALFQDAEALHNHVQPQSLVSIRLRLRILPVVAMVAVFCLLLASLIMLPVMAPLADNPVVDPEGMTDWGEQIRQVAALVEQHADQSANPYLRAVARAMEELGENVEANEISPEAAEQELDRLLGHLSRTNEFNESLVSDVRSLLVPFPRDPQRSTSITQTPEPNPISELQTTDLGEEGIPGPDTSASSQEGHSNWGGALEDLLSRLEAEVTRNELGPRPIPNVTYELSNERYLDFDDHEFDPALLATLERQRQVVASLRPELPLGGDLGGAGDGASIEPGAGSQPLMGEDAQVFADWTADTDDLVLPYAVESRRRIRMDIVPEAQFTDVSEVTPAGDGGWRRLGEAPRLAEFLDTSYRSAVIRYFAPQNSSYDSNP